MTPFPRSALALAIVLAGVPGARAQTAPTQAELAARLDRLAAELAAVKAQLAQMQAAAPPPAAPANAPPAPPAANAPAEPATVLSSYGEINVNRPRHDAAGARADLRRFVLGAQHRFDARTRVVAELEVEHAVTSKDDDGEVALEQAYVERQLGAQWVARAGLFLVPLGLLNENHEPTAYYGVERNAVETAIIPSTWREGGLQLAGSFDNGLSVQAGLATGFDLNKWDFGPDGEGAQSPLGSIHQELALARARDVSVFGAFGWRGMPGLLVGGGLFSGDASQGQPGTPSARVTLWDLHARWTPGRWDLSGVVAHGRIGGSAAINLQHAGEPNPVPERFDGWYAQAAYALWKGGDYSFEPFLRYERVNTGRAFADLGPGLTPAAFPTERIVTLGASLRVGAGVVLKADVQRYRVDADADRVNLGLGWSF